MKRYALIGFVLLFSIILFACGENDNSNNTMNEVANAENTENKENMSEDKEEKSDEMMVFTLEELAKYNGENGQPAYVAVDGVVYDVTDVPAWAGGKHNGNMAGIDASEVIKEKSPHGLKVLENLPVVGELTSAAMEEKNTFTLEELSMYDGKNGNPAYVAVDGIVYDVSDVPAWAGGKHNGNMAGQDVTEVIKSKSPHGLNVLEILPVVGELVE
ncbi:cytochrome b5 domain-containing protein [Acidaminobacter sp. JC074]|uniref:cytochrome b5 domain-containing protein n=1 Tax=Acidaminobacter sp. JC074 TaxID=2530199 RepID=UPI001F0EEA37|nr:cytochrome b5 domain-containing protein [Acidaminobacter sp. JC074]